jgi:hypothetical protein
LTAKDVKQLDRKYLLSLLNEMNDLEVLLLCLHGRSSMNDFTFEFLPLLFGFRKGNRSRNPPANVCVHLR